MSLTPAGRRTPVGVRRPARRIPPPSPPRFPPRGDDRGAPPQLGFSCKLRKTTGGDPYERLGAQPVLRRRRAPADLARASCSSGSRSRWASSTSSSSPRACRWASAWWSSGSASRSCSWSPAPGGCSAPSSGCRRSYLLGADVPPAPRAWETVEGVWAKLKAHFGSAATWKDLSTCSPSCAFGIVSTTLLVTAVAMVFWFFADAGRSPSSTCRVDQRHAGCRRCGSASSAVPARDPRVLRGAARAQRVGLGVRPLGRGHVPRPRWRRRCRRRRPRRQLPCGRPAGSAAPRRPPQAPHRCLRRRKRHQSRRCPRFAGGAAGAAEAPPDDQRRADDAGSQR